MPVGPEPFRSSRSRLLGCLLSLLVAAPAAAQNALGDGQALDANPQVGTGGRNTRSLVPDFRARNLLITGDVVGGRGFRGTVGYFAANDFRDDELGSNDLFSFRADSALSNPALFTAGQTFQRLRMGQQLGVLEYHRSGAGATPDTVRAQTELSARIADERLALDQLSISASSSLVYRGAIEPEIVGAFRDEQGTPLVAAASSLRGLQVTPLAAQPQLIGLTPYDVARSREDADAGQVVQIGEPFGTGFQDLLAPEVRGESPAADGRVSPDVFTTKIDPGYRGILERISDRYVETTEQIDVAGETDLASQLDAAFAELREQLGIELTPPAATTPPADAAAPELSLPDFGVILRHGEIIERYATGDPGRFQELMAQAEEMLQGGEYFWAERRFTRALRFTPGHPLATAGLAHAQIGAGLYVSAALTLRRLLARHPEMIDARFGPDLLPNRVRLNIAVRALEGDIEQIERDRELAGFLLAYLGHQIEDRALVERGLAVVAATTPDDPLLPLLRNVWLGSEAGQPADGADELDPAEDDETPEPLLPSSYEP